MIFGSPLVRLNRYEENMKIREWVRLFQEKKASIVQLLGTISRNLQAQSWRDSLLNQPQPS